MVPHYRHSQVGWVVIVAVLAAVLVVVPLVAIPGAPLGAVLVAAVVLLAGVAFSILTVEVDARELRVSFTGGLVRRRIALAEVRAVRAVRNPWYYGWGIHVIPHGWIWNVSGLDGVELHLHDGHVFRIGTDEPEALVGAIERFAPHGESSTGAEVPATERRARGPLFAVLVTAAVLAGAVLFVAPFYLQTRPPKVTVTRHSIVIQSLFYGDEYPMDEVTAVSLEPELPRILARTNGFAGGGVLRGWFRVDGLGTGKLFVDLGNAPYVLVRTRSRFAIVSFSDARRTQALYQEIEAKRRPR